MTKNKFIKNKWNIIFAIMIVLIAAVNVIWIRMNKTAPAGNGLTDLFPGINFYLDVVNQKTPIHDIINSGVSLHSLIRCIYELGDYIRYTFYIYPPLAPVSYSLAYFIFGFQSHLELTINIVYLILALWGIYKIGSFMFNQRVGLFSAFVFSSFPGIIVKTRHIGSEYIMTCLIPIVFLFLFRTDAFRNKRFSVFFGVSLGFLALAKWEFLITVSFPLMLYLLYSFFLIKSDHNKSSDIALPLDNLFMSLFIATIVAFPWYVVGLQDAYWRIFLYDKDKVAAINTAAISWQWFIDKISYYFLAVANGGINFFYLALFVISLVLIVVDLFSKRALIKKRKHSFYLIFIFLWIIIPYIVISFMAVRNLSHALVILPAIALVIGIGVSACRSRYLKVGMIFLTIAYGICNYARPFVAIKKLDFINSIRVNITSKGKLRLAVVDLSNQYCFAYEGKRLYEPDLQDWKADEFIAFVQQDSRNLGYKPLVYFLGLPIEEFTPFSLQYYNLLSGFTFYLEPRGNDKTPCPPDRSHFDYVAVVADKMVNMQILDERLFVISYNVDHKNHKTLQFREDFFLKFIFVRDILLPDGLRIYIYKRTKE